MIFRILYVGDFNLEKDIVLPQRTLRAWSNLNRFFSESSGTSVADSWLRLRRAVLTASGDYARIGRDMKLE